MLLSLSTITLLGFGLAVASQDRASPNDEEPIFICPLPSCGECPSKERLASPAVGFALDVGYG